MRVVDFAAVVIVELLDSFDPHWNMIVLFGGGGGSLITLEVDFFFLLFFFFLFLLVRVRELVTHEW